MAASWVKMRTDLYRDPKVCAMAEELDDPDGPLARYVSQNCQCDMAVTRNVTRNAVVGSLVTLWGVTRVIGKRNALDLVLPKMTLSVLDDMAELPGIGAAMAAVGWAIETTEGVVFPNFFDEYNVDPANKAADRQRRYRERKRDVTRDVTRDDRGEERREESMSLCVAKAKRVTCNPRKAAGVFSTLTESDIQSDIKLLRWFEYASKRRKPVVDPGEENALLVFGAAERAIEKSDERGPVALFAYIVSKKMWHLISNAQEDRARKRLHAAMYPEQTNGALKSFIPTFNGVSDD